METKTLWFERRDQSYVFQQYEEVTLARFGVLKDATINQAVRASPFQDHCLQFIIYRCFFVISV